MKDKLYIDQLGETNVGTIAEVIHAMVSTVGQINGIRRVPDWIDLDDEQRMVCIAGVCRAIDDENITAEQAHQEWLDWMAQEGWTYGNKKSLKDKTHPFLVPWEQLPKYYQERDQLFILLVKTLIAHYRQKNKS